MRKNIFILGIGAGPISSAFLRSRLKRIVNYAGCVIVRDEESKDFLKKLGVTRQIDVEMDAATYMERSFFAPGAGRPSVIPPPVAEVATRTVAIHLVDFDAPYWDATAEVVTEFCLGEPAVRALLITDSVTRTLKPTTQEKALRRLKQLLPEATQVEYCGDPSELCRLLDTIDLVVTNKLHVGIVGVALDKQVISLPQHVKTPRFYRQLGLSSVCIVDNRPERLRELLELWRSGELPRVTMSARRNVYLDALRLHLGAGS